MSAMPASMEVSFDVHEYQLSPREETVLREKLDSLSRQVDHFPFAELRAYIQGVRSNEVVVKLTLLLPGTTLSVDDHDLIVQPAFDRCLDSLIQELHGYKDRLNRNSEAAKLVQGTHHEIRAAVPIDQMAMEEAVANGDYSQFYTAMLPYEEELRMRAGRWVQRYPEIDAVIGDKLEIADIVEETLLLAFDAYGSRPVNVPLGIWLDKLIDEALRELAQHPEEAMQNISAVRTARDAVEGREPV